MNAKERIAYDAEQIAIAVIGTPPNAAEYEVFYRQYPDQMPSWSAFERESPARMAL